MSTPTRIIHDLPAMTYDGLTAYVGDISTNWEHMLASRAYYQVDGDAHEWTKRESLKVSVTLLFLNTIAPGQFPQNWNKWKAALLRGDARLFKHPDIGTFYARPSTVGYSIKPQETAGVEVKIDFIESINSADDPSKLTTNSSGAMAQAAADTDYAMAALGIDYPDGMPSPTFEEFVNSIASLGFTFQTQVAGKLAQLQGLADAVYAATQSLAKAQAFADSIVKDAIAGAPLRWLLEHSLNSLRVLAAAALEEVSRGARKTKSLKTSRAMSLAAASFELAVPIGDMIELNPSLLLSPIVPAGAEILYYAGA